MNSSFRCGAGFQPQPPVAANLGGAMKHLLSQALESEFPGAPDFQAEAKLTHLKKVYEVVAGCVRSNEGRILVDQKLRHLVAQIANPLMLGEMAHDATHFVLGHHWPSHFSRKASETGNAMTVGQLREWINDPKPMGMPREAENLVILTFADQTNRTFFRHGAPIAGSLTSLPDDCELREEKLPDQAQWDIAVHRTARIFGETISPLRKATNVANLVTAVKHKASEGREPCQQFCRALQDRMVKLGIAADSTDRFKTSAATLSLVEALHAADDTKVVETLAGAAIATSEAAVDECLAKASQLNGTLDSANWEIFDAIGKLDDDRKPAAAEIRHSITQALSSDEHVVSLGAALQGAQSKALRLLTARPDVPPPVDPPITVPPPVPPKPGKKTVKHDSLPDLSLDDAQSLLTKLKNELTARQEIRLDVTYTIEESENDG